MNATTAPTFVVGEIDRSRWYLPEHLTPLAHAPAYRELPESTRRRYNQLFASCYHEHFIFLEQLLADVVLPGLIARHAGEPLARQLRAFQAEERVHTGWFHALHRASEPHLYQDNHHFFVRVSPLAQRILRLCAARPTRFPFILWLAMLIEERTLPAAREILRDADRLEPHYALLHRLHAADEAGHVSCDGELLKRWWPALNPVARALNRWLFVALLREFFQLPKRAGWRVVRQLAEEVPAVVPWLPRLRREMFDLRHQPGYLATLYSREREPRTFALADTFHDLRKLEQRVLGPVGRPA